MATIENPDDSAGPSGQRLAPWRALLAGVWLAAVLLAGVATRLDPDFRLCKTTTVTTEPTQSVEHATDARGKPSGRKKTSSGATIQSTSSCEPLAVGELAVLLLPFLILIAPVLKSMNIAGLLGVDFRDLTEKAATKGEERAIRVILESGIGATASQSRREDEKGEHVDLPQE